MRLNQTPESPAEPVSLDRLPQDVPAVVSHVEAGDEEIARMQSMGVCEGRPIHTVRAGSRMVVCAAGTRIGLDRRIAASVIVTPLPDGTPPCFG
ncbi:MAG: FeoA family protein [Planctomycetota bacterium]